MTKFLPYTLQAFSMPVCATQTAPERLLANYPDLLTVQHLAKATGLSEQTIRKEMHVGHIPSIHIGHRLFCSKKKFVEYIEGGLDESR